MNTVPQPRTQVAASAGWRGVSTRHSPARGTSTGSDSETATGITRLFFYFILIFVLTLLYKGTGTRNRHSLLIARPTCMLRSIPPRAELPTTTLIQPELRSTDRTTAAGGHSRGLCFTAKRMGLESVKRKSHLQLLLEHSPCWFGRRSSRRRWFLCRSKE